MFMNDTHLRIWFIVNVSENTLASEILINMKVFTSIAWKSEYIYLCADDLLCLTEYYCYRTKI